MKKGLLVVLLVFGWVSVASAVPYTWVDTLTFGQKLSSDFSYTHDITDNTPVAFVTGEDYIESYSLTMGFHDDKDNWYSSSEAAYIDLPGVVSDKVLFSFSDTNFGMSVAGWLSLNLMGTYDVVIDQWWGDFYLDYSTLTANGENNAPVPEPGTLLLLGSGLAGLAFYRRKRTK